MKLNVAIDLEEVVVGDYDETIAQVIRDEIERLIRQAVKDEMKEHKIEMQKKVRAVALAAAKQITKDKVEELAAKIAASVGI